MRTKLLFCVTLFAFVALKPVNGISTEQLEKMAKSLRKTCMQKVSVAEDLVEGLQRGEFPDARNLMCYTNCIMTTLRTFKNGAIDYDMIQKQADMTLPPEIANQVKVSTSKCRNQEYNGDPCQISFQYVKCYYEADPGSFMFP